MPNLDVTCATTEPSKNQYSCRPKETEGIVYDKKHAQPESWSISPETKSYSQKDKRWEAEEEVHWPLQLLRDKRWIKQSTSCDSGYEDSAHMTAAHDSAPPLTWNRGLWSPGIGLCSPS